MKKNKDVDRGLIYPMSMLAEIVGDEDIVKEMTKNSKFNKSDSYFKYNNENSITSFDDNILGLLLELGNGYYLGKGYYKVYTPITSEQLMDKYVELLQLVKDNEIHTFDFSSSRGYYLNNSTIDKLELNKSYGTTDIRVYYNENTDDYDYYSACFNAYELAEFYDGLIRYLYEDGEFEGNKKIESFFKEELQKEYVISNYYNPNCSEYYDDVPTSDLFALVAEQADKETILSVAEGYIGDMVIREFLLACLGCDIE